MKPSGLRLIVSMCRSHREFLLTLSGEHHPAATIAQAAYSVLTKGGHANAKSQTRACQGLDMAGSHIQPWAATVSAMPHTHIGFHVLLDRATLAQTTCGQRQTPAAAHVRARAGVPEKYGIAMLGKRHLYPHGAPRFSRLVLYHTSDNLTVNIVFNTGSILVNCIIDPRRAATHVNTLADGRYADQAGMSRASRSTPVDVPRYQWPGAKAGNPDRHSLAFRSRPSPPAAVPPRCAARRPIA